MPRHRKRDVTVQTNPAFYVSDQIGNFLDEQNWSEQLLKDDSHEPRFGVLLACCCFCLPVCVTLVIKNAYCPNTSSNEKKALASLAKTLDIIGAPADAKVSTNGVLSLAKGPQAVVDAINNSLTVDDTISRYRAQLEHLKAQVCSVYGLKPPARQDDQRSHHTPLLATR